MRVRVVLGSLSLAGAIVAAGLLVGRPGGGGGVEADAAAEVDGPRDAAASTLAAHARPVVVGSAAKPARGRVEGEVRRAGVPVAARVTLFENRRAERGTSASWTDGAFWSYVPTEEYVTASPVAGIDTDADGRFAFDDVPAGTYDVVATATAGGTGSREVVVGCDRALAFVRLEVSGGGKESLSGRVRHADGRPFRGFVARYTHESSYMLPRDASPVALDEQGRFRLEGLDPGPVSVLAYVPGACLVRSHVVAVPTQAELELVVDAALEETKGRVVRDEDGQPIPGAIVMSAIEDPIGLEDAEGLTVADGEGRFRVSASHGRTIFRIEAIGFAPLGTTRWFPEGEGFEFRLVRTAKVAGRVTSKADGAAVEGVDVYVLHGSNDAGPHAVSKADGRYEIASVIPGDVVVVACGGGWLSDGFTRASERFNPFAVAVEPGAVATVDLVVTRGARVAGVVLDAAGKPAPGARVRAERRLPGDSDDGVFGFLGEAQGVATGPDGRFEIESLAPGSSYDFHATHPNASAGKAGPLRVEAEKSPEVEVRLGAPRFAEVLVRQEGGGPIASVEVCASSSDESERWRANSRARTGANGIARLGPLPPGPLSFGASSDDGYEGESVTAGGPAGNTDPVSVELVVERALSISGTVRYADGSSVEDATLRIESKDSNETADVGAEGTFRFAGLAAGRYELTVTFEGASDPVLTTSVEAGDEHVALVVKATRPERLEVTVLDAEGRRAGRGGYRIDAGEGNSHAGSFGEGRFRVEVPGAEWSVLLYGLRSANGGPSGSAPVIAGPFPAGARAQEIRLPPERRIEGVVRAPDGHGVRGVRVAAAFSGLPAPFAQVTSDAATVRTDDQGRFRLGGLGDFTYRLRVSVGGGYGAIEPVDVLGGHTDVVLILKVGDAVAPVVVDYDGRPVAGAYLKVTGAATESVAESDGEGRAPLEGLDAKRTYDLSIEVPFGRADLLPLRRAEWTPSSEPIVLPRAYRLAGVVRDTDGRPVAGATVDLKPSAGDSFRVESRGDGTFEFSRVPAGRVSLRASRDGPERCVCAPVLSIAGAADVVLVAERTTQIVVRLPADAPVTDDATVRVHAETGGGGRDWESVRPDRSAVFGGLQPSTRYVFVADVEVPGSTTHLVGIAKGIRGDAGTVELALVEGRSLRGRLRFPPGAKELRVWVTSEGEARSVSVDEDDGRFTVEGLFEGECVVDARGETEDGVVLRARATATAGGAVELELRPER